MIIRPLLRLLVPSFIGLLLANHGARAGASADSPSWILDANKEGVVTYSRPHEGSRLKEFKSVGLIAAAPMTVYAVLRNAADYPRFMPYAVEVRVLQESGDSVVAYQRLGFPMVDDRDYVLRSVHTVTSSPAGPVYHIRWKPAVGIGPTPQPGVQRITTCEGSWLLEPAANGATRATYSIYSDTGGAIPAFLANGGSRTAIRKVFAAVRKEALDPKYAQAKG